MGISLAFLAAPWLLFFWQLSSELTVNPTFQFALLAPIIVGFLARERAQNGFAAQPPKSRLGVDLLLLAGYALLLPLRLLFEANADWRLIQWLQGLLSAVLTLLGLYRWGGRPMIKAFGGLALLPLLCIPWPTTLEKTIGTQLMGVIAQMSVEVVHLMGYEAQRLGNLIFLPNGTTVGVEEACSGLRSLAGNLFAAGALGQMFALNGLGRGFLLLLSVFISLIFNLLRSLILVITAATSGSQWTLLLHDSAGWSILLLSFGALYLIGKSLAPKTAHRQVKFAPPPALPRWLTLGGLALVLLSEPLVHVYYRTAPPKERIVLKDARQTSVVPKLTDDAERFRTMLFYDRGTSWRWRSDAGDWQLFYFEWNNPRLSRLGGAYHRPERCLPNTGWKLDSPPRQINIPLSGQVELPATLTHFTDVSGRHATLLFVHWGNDLGDIGLDTRLDPAQRWADFVAQRRLEARTALQLSVVGPTTSAQIDEQMVETAQALLTVAPAR